MSSITIIKEVKKIFPEYVIMIQSGKFYRVYGKDACIISYLFKYKIQEKEGTISSGFPSQSINKVESRLDNKKINYMVLERRDNYSENEKNEFGNLNNYSKMYEKAKPYAQSVQRIEKINEYFNEHVKDVNFAEILSKVESVINGKWKV